MELTQPGQIPRDECWELLRSGSIGRLGLSVGALPVILPVQYHVDGDELAICLGHHDVRDGSISGAVVAFAADSMRPDTTGWSVQVQGTTSLTAVDGLRTDCGQPTAGQMIQLAPVTMSGYWLRLCPFAAAPGDGRLR